MTPDTFSSPTSAASAGESEQSADPIMDRALFFLDLEIAELSATIPRASAPTPKQVY